ncbi:MAG: hypothetical protein CMH82_02780 [Nocardioides sp.]|nr:hypothetical protein [Nocardioides sp.]
MGDKVQAIVRGPENYFDGTLHAPGSIVVVDADQVSDKDTITKTVKVRLKEPAMVEGKLVRFAEEEVEVRTRFLPLEGAAIAEPNTTTAEVATGQPDRLNVSDFLKGGVDDIEDAIASGKVDAFLDVIGQAEIGGKGRKGVKEAITDRKAALSR